MGGGGFRFVESTNKNFANYVKNLNADSAIYNNIKPPIFLERFEFSAYSQNGEDGIIDFLIEILELENSAFPKAFVEFGVQNYTESNTRFLLKKRNFIGLVIDGSRENIEYIKQDEIYWRFDLCAQCEFITRENIDDIIKNWLDSAKISNIALLSIDIDGVDYFVWEAIKCVQPAIIVVEYNALLGGSDAKSVPYSADFERFREDFSGLYFGASITAMVNLGERKGFKFVGADSSGTNLFFVNNKLAHKVDFLQLHSFDEYCQRHRARQSRDERGQLNFMRGDERIKHLANKNFIKCE